MTFLDTETQRRPHLAARLLFAALAMCSWAGHTAASPAFTPPRLDDVPAPGITGTLPAPAIWPVLRYERSPRLLVLTGKGTFLSPYQAIARRLHGTLEARYLDGCDARYHVNDKWIEPKDNPTDAELTAYARQVVVETVRSLTRPPRFDVVFLEANTKLLADPEVTGALLDHLHGGGVVVVTGNFYPEPASALAAIWPAQATNKNSWMSGGAVRAGGPELAGVPAERLTGHVWIPVAEAANGGRALATGEAGALFAATIGSGTLLYCPTGPMSRRHDALETVVHEYDHDEVWLRYWDQVLPEVLWGREAFPAYVERVQGSGFGVQDGRTSNAQRSTSNVQVQTPTTDHRSPITDHRSPTTDHRSPISDHRSLITDHSSPGLALDITVVNRAAKGPLTGSVHVVSPLGEVVYRSDVPVTAQAGTSQQLTVPMPVAAHWGAGLYRVYFTLGDAAAKKQLHQSLTFVEIPGTVQLALAADRPGYRIGETAQVTATASSPEPWAGKLVLGIYDFRGRLLSRDERALALGTNPVTTTFAWPMVDHGVRVDTYQVVVAAVKDGTEWARAEMRIDKREPWNMRNEYQWSPWSGLTCLNPSTALPAMRLLGHAGFNALGYPGRTGLAYPAERWGWRYYNEGIGINTFSPVIEYENDAEIEARVRQEAKGRGGRDLTSPAFVLASVGEEAGFKNGWGHTYYWDTPAAPDKANRAFQWYLRTRYPDLTCLNATWRTSFRNWEEIQLTKEFSANPDKYLENDGWAHPKLMPPLSEGAAGVSLAPFTDTKNFYAWYYDRFVAAAKRVFREQINPVSLTMASAPSSWIFASRECDVQTAGPGAWNESQTHSLTTNDAPTFGLIWGHFDWSLKTEDLLWGFLLQRTGHNDYWWDALMFNGDMTHTRSTVALRRWTAQLAGHEQAILDSRPVPADVGLLEPNGLLSGQDFKNMHSSVAVALMQGGFAARNATIAEIAPYRIVFAVGLQALSADDAARLDAYVTGGGTLVFTPRFGSQDEFGGPQATAPGQGLAERWGLTTDAKRMGKRGQKADAQFALDAVAPELTGCVAGDLSAHRFGGFREGVKAPDWATLATYPDGTPALLTRALGKGRLVFLNAVYASHSYIQFRTPTDAPRQGFFRLAGWLCRQAGAQPALQLQGDLEQLLHLAVGQFADSTGHIRYLILKNSIDAPWVTGRVRWQNPNAAIYDVFTGTRYGAEIPVQFRPDQGRWLAVLEKPVKQITVTAAPAKTVAGTPLRVTVHVRDVDGRDVPGAFSLTLTVARDGHEIPGRRRSCALASGGEITLPTALNDPAGTWTITVVDGITGSAGKTSVRVSAPASVAVPDMRALGWPSENAEPQQLSQYDFVGRLQRLADLYLKDQTNAGGKSWLTKQMLGAYYDWFPGSRHALLRPLYDVDWTTYVPAWRKALQDGATFVLIGEDLGTDPGTGLAIYPHADARQFAAIVHLLRGARWQLGTADGDTIVATLGQGSLVLCRESIDAAGHTNPDAARWQQRWLAELANTANGKPLRISVPGEEALRRWWQGEPLTREPRTMTWFGGNQRELPLVTDPAKPLDCVFTFALPPAGTVKTVEFSIAGAGAGTATGDVTLDIGADDTVDATIAPTAVANSATASLDWPAAVNRYLTWRAAQGGPVRDENGWRLVPVRVQSKAGMKLTLSGARVVVQ